MRVDDAETPCVGAVAGFAGAGGGEVGVVEGGDNGEGRGCGGIGLVVPVNGVRGQGFSAERCGRKAYGVSVWICPMNMFLVFAS